MIWVFLIALACFAAWNGQRLDDPELKRAQRIADRIVTNHAGKVLMSARPAKRRIRAGYSWNPWLELPRNRPCPCDSGKKFKNCHFLSLPRAVTAQEAIEAREAMSKAGVDA